MSQSQEPGNPVCTGNDEVPPEPYTEKNYNCLRSSFSYINNWGNLNFSYYEPDINQSLKTIRINFVVIQDDYGQNNYPNNQTTIDFFNTTVSDLNGVYRVVDTLEANPIHPDYEPPYISDTRIRFELDTVLFLKNSQLNTGTYTFGTVFMSYLESLDIEGWDESINVFFTEGHYPGYTAEGFANLPSDNWDSNQYVVTFQKYSRNKPFHVLSRHLAHELGHNLGLRHPYDSETFNASHPEYLSDLLNDSINYGISCIPSSNCDVCFQEGGWECSPLDPFTTCTNNLMGGTNQLKYHTTPKQMGRMHRTLSIKNTNKYIKDDSYTPMNWQIEGDEDWDFRMRFYNNLMVSNQSNLTISCYTEMIPNADIIIESGSTLTVDGELFLKADNQLIIEPGAELIVLGTIDMGSNGLIITKPEGKITINGGVITNSCGNYWQGIYVEGDRFLPQTFENQGALILQNGAIIENAKDAVMLKGVDDDWAYNGGIIQATDATFRNNWRNVEFMSYQNTNTQGQPIDNISYFTNCTFTTDDETLHDTHTANVTMWNVTGVRFTNCTFTDERDNIDYYGYRTSRDGIYTKEATFRVWESGFNHMKFGIHSIATIPDRYFSVYLSDFSSFKGIYFNAKDNVTIMDNTFSVAPGYTYPGSKCGDTYGIYINNSSNFTIENNQFFSTSNGATMCGSLGIIARNTGSYPNKIYRNDLEGFTVGIEAIGENKGSNKEEGLELQCNRNLENAFDFFVTSDDLYRWSGIRELQGYSDNPDTKTLAGNLFGNNSSILVANFINTEANISYFHHDPASEPRVVPAIYSDPPKINLYPTTYEYTEASCPKQPVPKTLEQLQDERNESLTLYTETEILLQSHIDDGNTDLMTQQVEMAGDGDAYTTYQYLMQTSPYVSEDVLTTLGAKEDGFNKAMIRDVLVENPQSAKSEDVNLALDSRMDPLPAYMRWQINNGLYHFSEMEVMRHFMAYQKTRHDRALNQILGGIIRNEEGFENAPSVEEILTGVDDIRYQYMLAEWHFGKGNFTQGMQLLGQIEQNYDLSDEALWNAHEDKLGFYNWLSQWDQEEHPGYTGLPEVALQELENYLDATPRIAGKALSLLLLNEAIEYEEPILYPDVVLKSEPAHQQTMPLIPEMDEEFTFRLYPNPSREYITLDWCFDSPQMKGVIEIRNAAGVLLDAVQAGNQCDQQIYPLTQLRSGTYTATLISGNHIRKSLSFVVIK